MFFNHLTKVRWSFEFFLNGKILSNKGFLKTFIKLIDVHLHKCIIMSQFHIHNSCDFLQFWSSNHLYVIFKIIQSEWNLICCVTFDTICSSKFYSNCVHHSLPTPNTLHESSITPKFLHLNPSTITIHDFLSSSWLPCSHSLMNMCIFTRGLQLEWRVFFDWWIWLKWLIWLSIKLNI